MIETGAHRATAHRRRALPRCSTRLIDVFTFERFLGRAYLGQKSFSIEGLDVIVPMLDELVTLACRPAPGASARHGPPRPAHRPGPQPRRGRSTRSSPSSRAQRRSTQVKTVAALPHHGTGDVKYHYGHLGTYRTPDGERSPMHLYPNPSHLEFVDPVVTGAARFEQTDFSGPSSATTRPAQSPSCCTATRRSPARVSSPRRSTCRAATATPPAARSTSSRTTRSASRPTPTTAARPPTRPTWRRASTCRSSTSTPTTSRRASRAMRLAMAYRERWGRDVVIDVIGYRRYGHNEADEPAYTQPIMAAKIKPHPPVSEIYSRALVADGVVSPSTSPAVRAPARADVGGAEALRDKMEAGDYEDPTRRHRHRRARPLGQPARRHDRHRGTAARAKRAAPAVPESFTVHRKLRKPLAKRLETINEGGIEFGHAESARLRVAGHRRGPHPAHRPGHRAWHVLPSPRRPARREDRPQLLPDAEPRRREVAVRALQQPAVGERLPGLRVRLLGRAARRPHPLGGPVRRLRQLGPGDHRPASSSPRRRSGARGAG